MDIKCYEDRYGCIYIDKVVGYRHTTVVYLHVDYDVDNFKDSLSRYQRRQLEDGYRVRMMPSNAYSEYVYDLIKQNRKY